MSSDTFGTCSIPVPVSSCYPRTGLCLAPFVQLLCLSLLSLQVMHQAVPMLQAVQECGQTLLIALTNNLAFYYPLDGYAASSRQHKAAQSPGTDVPHPSGHGLKVESWGEFRYRDGTPAFEEPTFHQPSQEEVCCLHPLCAVMAGCHHCNMMIAWS